MEEFGIRNSLERTIEYVKQVKSKRKEVEARFMEMEGSLRRLTWTS